jgi:hypothetical protein
MKVLLSSFTSCATHLMFLPICRFMPANSVGAPACNLRKAHACWKIDLADLCVVERAGNCLGCFVLVRRLPTLKSGGHFRPWASLSIDLSGSHGVRTQITPSSPAVSEGIFQQPTFSRDSKGCVDLTIIPSEKVSSTIRQQSTEMNWSSHSSPWLLQSANRGLGQPNWTFLGASVVQRLLSLLSAHVILKIAFQYCPPSTWNMAPVM